MNKTQKDKYNHLMEKLDKDYGDIDSYNWEAMIDFAREVVQEQANKDILFLDEIFENIEDGDTEYAKELVNDWINELKQIVEE